LEKIPDRFRDLFKIISLDGENAIKESVAEIAELKTVNALWVSQLIN
jgi:hypothetical protein